MRAIRILTAVNNSLAGCCARLLIEREAGLELVGEVADGTGALSRSLTLMPRVLLMEESLPGMRWDEVIRGLWRKVLGIGVLLLMEDAGSEVTRQAFGAGVKGIMTAPELPAHLTAAIRTLAGDGWWLHDAPVTHAWGGSPFLAHVEAWREPPLARLTPRDCQLLAHISRGLSNKQIAEELYLGVPTVKNAVSALLRKLELPNRTAASLYAQRAGLVEMVRAQRPGEPIRR